MGTNKTESKHIFGSVICGLLTVFGIVASIISIIGGSNGLWLIADCSFFILYTMIAYYVFMGYKKPHGNLLKYIILIYAAQRLIVIPSFVKIEKTVSVIFCAVIIGLMCYIAGRLVKVKENLILTIILTVCMITMTILNIGSGTADIGAINYLVIWIDICVAYFLRYKEHREAGLEDAERK